MKICTIYDTKSETYSAPFVAKVRGEALRIFIDHASNPETLVGKYPGDFHLMEVADWDDSTATITPYEAKVNLGTALELSQKS